MQQYRKNLGKVSLTAEGAWNLNNSYDILSIVYDEHTQHGFISRKAVPQGVDLYNKEYWMPLNVSGYADNNVIILSKKTSEANIQSYTLEEAIASIKSVGRRPGAILGFYNENNDRLDIGGRWELWQFNDTNVYNWENVDSWQNLYYNYNKFMGWFKDENFLTKYAPFPEIGCYAFVGSEFNEATVYRCDNKYVWNNTTQHAWDYVKVIVGGNVTVGENGNWFNNGEDTGIPASVKGENGNTPVFREKDNTIQYSFDNINWITISNKVAAWFRWNATTGDTQANNVGRIQISRDNVTWTNLSGDIINNLHISRYIGADETLPTNGIAEGTIYAKGPTYADEDTSHANPIYRLWVYAWKGDTLAWQDNGEFNSIAAGVVQETGNSETQVMSQAAVTRELSELGSETKKYLINEEYLVSNTRKEYDVVLKSGYSYIFTIRMTDSYPGAQIAISNKSNGSSIVTMGAITGGSRTRYLITPESDIVGIETYCNGDFSSFKLENIDLANENLYNKFADLKKEYIIDSFIEGKKLTKFYTNIEANVIYKAYAELPNGAFTQFNICSIDSNGNDLELLLQVGESNKEYSFVPTQDAYGIKVYSSQDDIERFTITNPLSIKSFNRDIEENNNATKIIKKDLNNEILEYPRTVNKGVVIYGNAISSDLFKVGQSVKYKLECDTFIDTDGVEKPIIEGFSFGTNNGHYFDYRFTEKPNEWHTHEVTEEMFRGVPISTGIEETKLFRIYVPSSKVLVDGNVTLYYIIDLADALEGRVEILENKGIGSVSNIPSVSDSLFEDKYQESLAINKEVPKYKEGTPDVFIEIDSQSKFDNVENLIKEQLSLGKKNICVYLNAEELYFSERHFNLVEDKYPHSEDVHLSIQGNGNVKVKAGGVTYNFDKSNIQNGKYVVGNNSGEYQPKGMFLVGDRELETASEIKYALSIVEIVESHLSGDEEIVDVARIKIEDYNTNPSYILLTASFQSHIFKVVKSEDGYVYFNAAPILYWRPAMTINRINADYVFAYINPRYILFNDSNSPINIDDNYIKIDLKYKSVHRCLSQTFVYIDNCFKSVKISGLHFIGNVDKGIQDYNPETKGDSLIQIDKFANSFVMINNNRFDYIRSEICAIGGINASEVVASNVLFEGNEAYHCYRGMISASQYTDSIYAIGNIAKDMGRAMYYEGVFNVVGSNFLIANNEVEDFTYAAVRSGIEYPREGWNGSEGIIENNTVGWSEQYAAENWKHGKMDAGAIYAYCRHTRLIIRNNLVYNYKGFHVSRGIYVDGYAENVSVYSNMVIDSGADRGIILYRPSEDDGKKSTNNLCVYNVITNRYKFTGYSNCYKGLNYVILPFINMVPDNEIDVPNVENDYNLYNGQTVCRGIRVPFKYQQQINKFKIPDRFKTLFFTDKYL